MNIFQPCPVVIMNMQRAVSSQRRLARAAAVGALAWLVFTTTQAQPDVRRDAVVQVTEEVMPWEGRKADF
jgi:hypothetical protein